MEINKTYHVLIYNNDELEIHEVVIFNNDEYEKWKVKPHVIYEGWRRHDVKNIVLSLKNVTKEGFEIMNQEYNKAVDELMKKVFKNSIGTPLVLKDDTRFKHSFCFTNEDLINDGHVKHIAIVKEQITHYKQFLTKQQTTLFNNSLDELENIASVVMASKNQDPILDQEDLFDE